jgi:hypothetical protein
MRSLPLLSESRVRFSGLVSLALGFCLATSGPVAAQSADLDTSVPERIPVEFKRPARPFMLISAAELAAAKEKLATQPWAQKAFARLQAEADQVIADPQLFPASESGWTHKYISPRTGERLKFDPKNPRRHLEASTGEYLVGEAYDQAWNQFAQFRTAQQQEVLAAIWSLTGDKRYAETMRTVFLDLARKYSTYRLHDKSMKLKPDGEPVGTYADTGGYATSQSIDECALFTSLAFSYDTLAGSGVLSAEEEAEIEAKVWTPLRAYMRRLMALHPSGGNWWIWHTAGAVVTGVVTGDQDLVDQGLNLPDYGLLAQLRSGYINADGFTAELSPTYQAYPYEALMRLAMAARRVGVDFYQVARFRSGFDLPLKIMQPNFRLPRLNDGGYASLLSPYNLNRYEIAATWYPENNYGNLLTAAYTTAEPRMERESLEALLYGPTRLPIEPLPQPGDSQFLKASGLCILRSPENDWNVVLKNDIGLSGHRHPDALNLILFANGEEVFPGTGSPSYGHPTYRAWFSQTIAHNTVVLNATSQEVSPSGKVIEFGYAHEGIGVAQSTATSAALQGSPAALKNASPTALRRTIVLLPSAIVDILRAAPEGANPEVLPDNTMDLPLHFQGTLSMAGKWPASQDALLLEKHPNSTRKPPHQGYGLIEDLCRADDPSSVRGRLTQANGGAVDLWLAPAPEGGAVYSATGVGLETTVDKRLPMLLQRRVGKRTSFAAVYAPWKQAPVVTRATFPASEGEGVAVVIEHGAGKDLVLSLPGDGEFTQAGATLTGTLGASCERVGGGKQVLLVGKAWKQGALEIELPGGRAGVVLVDLSLTRVSVRNLGTEAIEARVKQVSNGAWTAFTVAPLASVSTP